MFLQQRLHDCKTMLSIGMLCLLLANVLRWFCHPTTLFGQDLLDGVFGLLIGLSIGANLLSLRQHPRQRGQA